MKKSSIVLLDDAPAVDDADNAIRTSLLLFANEHGLFALYETLVERGERLADIKRMLQRVAMHNHVADGFRRRETLH